MFERILVPLDGSREAESIFPTLRGLLRRKDSEVILFQAIDLPLAVLLSQAASVLEGMEAEAAASLESWRKDLEDAGARVRVLVDTGRPSDAILKAAESMQASLIAMSTHGRAGLARWVMGSVTEDVLRRSAVPVLVAKPQPPEPSTAPASRSILVPFDGRDESLCVAPLVIELAHLFDAGVAVLKVEDGPPGGGDLGFVGLLMEGPSSLEGKPDLLDRDLIAAGNRFAEAGVRTTLFRVRGDIASKINHLARILPAQMIVMASHGRHGMSRLITGSVAEDVARKAESPVVIRRIGVAEPAELM